MFVFLHVSPTDTLVFLFYAITPENPDIFGVRLLPQVGVTCFGVAQQAGLLEFMGSS
jgi:hypothetical protein